MEIDKVLLKRIAENARLELSEEEEREFLPQLKEVLESFSKLSKLETNCEPTFHPVKNEAILRKDEVKECFTQDQALSNTKHSKDGYFKGPRGV